MPPFHQTISAFERQISKTGRYTNVVCCEVKILHLEENPGPSATPNFFRGERRYCVLSFFLVSLSHALAWPLELGIWTPTLWRGPSSWGYGLPRFGVAPQVGDTDSHALVWPLELGIRTRTLLEVLQCSKTITSYDRSQCVLLALSVCALGGA